MRNPCRGVGLRRHEDGTPVVWLHYSADPEHGEEWAAEQRKTYPSQVWWDLEMEIKYEARSGQLVYPTFDPLIHVIDDSEIPKRMCRFMSIDPHPRTPHAALWVGIDRWSDWYVYRELWPSVFYGAATNPTDDVADHNWTIREYAEAIALLEGNQIEWRNAETDRETGIYRRNPGGERVVARFMDQAGKGFKASGESEQFESHADRYNRYGIHCSDPVKAHEIGEEAIRELLKPRNHDTRGKWPRLHIAKSCIELILQLQRLRYQATPGWATAERDLKQEAVKARSHLIDNLRYLATSRIEYRQSLES